MKIVKSLIIGIKSFLLKLFTSLKFSSYIFLEFNLIWGVLYIVFLTRRINTYDYMQTIIHTFIASFTLSVPQFINFSTHNKSLYCLGIDLLVLIHMFVAFLFLGILISMVYRKVTRT